MGFHLDIGIARSAAALVRLLRDSPEEVFDRPYAGYLLFFFGAAHTEVRDWLDLNATGISALTGGYVAFAVFTSSYRVRVRLDAGRDPAERRRREPHRVGGTTVGKLQASLTHQLPNGTVSMKRLTKEHQFGSLVDGDEIDALSEGAEAMARAYGVVDQLPCIVVVDAIPNRDEVVTISLAGPALDKVERLIRRAMHQLNESKNFQVFLGQLERIDELKRTRETYDSEIYQLQKGSKLSSYEDVLENVELLLRTASTKKLSTYLKGIDEHYFSSFISYAEANFAALHENTRDVHYLEGAAAAAWPLAGEDRDRYEIGFKRRFSKLNSEQPSAPDADRPEQCRALLKTARNRKTALVEDIVGQFPRSELLSEELGVNDNGRIVFQPEARKLRRLREERAKATDEQLRLAKECATEAQPSLSKMVSELAKDDKLHVTMQKVGDWAAACGTKIFEAGALEAIKQFSRQ